MRSAPLDFESLHAALQSETETLDYVRARDITQRFGKAVLHGRLFEVVKFRTMIENADQHRGEVSHLNEMSGPVFKAARDPRLTFVGRVLRRLSLDELPQLWNVLRGDMSFVGPRPERPYFVEQLAAAIPFYMARHAVKPGVTGWAQVKYRYGASIEDGLEKLRYDLYYIKHMSLWLDLRILVDTVKIVLFGRGAR